MWVSSLFAILIVVLIDQSRVYADETTTEISTTCEWSDWVQTTDCPATCGSCGNATFVRTCPFGCACMGESTKIDYCNTNVCIYPNNSCCDGFYAKGGNGSIYCAAVSAITTDPSSAASICEWSDWIQTTNCPATCGSCGNATFVRTCPSECECAGESAKIDYCNTNVCIYPNNSCCDGFYAKGGNGSIYCAAVAVSTTSTTLAATTSTTTATATTTTTAITAADIIDTLQSTTTVVTSTVTSTTEGTSSDGSTTPMTSTSTISTEILSTSTTASSCEWSDWIQTTDCSATCGSCGNATFVRTCPSGCACTEESTKIDYCNTNVCIYPNNSCCEGFYAKGGNGSIYCAAVSATTTDPTVVPTSSTLPSCDSWSEWSQTSECSASCGSCGQATFIRNCTSGCSCTGATAKVDYCNTSPCPYPLLSCCTGFQAKPNNGTISCTACGEGTWSEWSLTTCSATCGLCGIQYPVRTCTSLASGCPCTGNATGAVQACGSAVCTFPLSSCCAPAKRGIVNRNIVCVASV